MIPLQTFLGALLVEGVLFAIPLLTVAVVHARERRDLYSRLMARDLTEFAQSQRGGRPPVGRNMMREALERVAHANEDDA